MDEKIIDQLRTALSELRDIKADYLVRAMKDALHELWLGNSEDGNWERARRAIHILECEIDFYERHDLRAKEEGK